MLKKLIPLLLLLALLPQITAANFSDNPEKFITQGEFLKLAMAKAEKNTKGNFIKTAKKEKWIPQKFEAKKTVTKKIALEILKKIQKHSGAIAKEKITKKKLKRKEAVALIEKAFVSNKIIKSNTTVKKENPQTPEIKAVQPSDAPAPQASSSQKIDLYKEELTPLPDPPAGSTGHFMIKKNFFEKIALDEEFPTNFYQNELYVFSGEISTDDANTTVFLTYKDQNEKNHFINFVGAVKNKKFEIPVFFEKKGKYFLGIIPGKNGNSKIVEISVGDFPEIPGDGQQNLQKIDLIYENEITKIRWEKNFASIRKISFEQASGRPNEPDNTLAIYSRQKRTKIPLIRKNFKNFNERKIKISLSEVVASSNFPLQIAGNWTKEAESEWEIERRIRTKNDTEAIKINEIPEKLPEPQKLEIIGKTNVNIQKKAAIRKPDGLVDEVEISGEKTGDYFKIPIILKDSQIKLIYTPEKKGFYQIEINNEAGSAVVNQAIFIGEKIPLLPDYFELYEQADYPEIKMDLEELRKKMLNIVNQIRKDHGLTAVARRDELNKLAQLHADDMVKRKFFAHINPDQETPQDRRKKLGIPTPVGENLAQSISVLHAVHGLIESPIHRRNILDPKWTTLGLGFALDEEKTLITAQEFSTNPLTENDLQNFEEEIWSEIIKKRQETDSGTLVRDITLTEIAKSWSQKLLTFDPIGFEAPDGSSIKKLLEEKNIQRETGIFLFETNTMENFVDYILQNATILENKWTMTGFAMSVSKMGDLKFTLILVK